MGNSMKRSEGERRGWILVTVFLLIGLLCVFVVGNLAIRFAPRWTLQADMRSRLDPDSAYFTSQPGFPIQPLDSAILTPPIWIHAFLTPGQVIPTRIPITPIIPTITPELTHIPPTNRPSVTPTSTGIFLFFTPTEATTPNPPLSKTATNTAAPVPTETSAITLLPTSIITATETWTATSMPTEIAGSSATPTATSVYTDPPPGEIGPIPDGNVYNLPAGGSLTLALDSSIHVNGHNGYDLVYYELPMGSGIWLDWVTVEVGDGSNWYTVFNWGDNIPDSNSNMDFTKLPYPVMTPFPPPEEPDQRDIPSDYLYPFPGTGVAIDLDGVVPPGTYPYIRFSCPISIDGVPDTDGKMEIDAIEVFN
jgi:hypothetical protein